MDWGINISRHSVGKRQRFGWGNNWIGLDWNAIACSKVAYFAVVWTILDTFEYKHGQNTVSILKCIKLSGNSCLRSSIESLNTLKLSKFFCTRARTEDYTVIPVLQQQNAISLISSSEMSQMHEQPSKHEGNAHDDKVSESFHKQPRSSLNRFVKKREHWEEFNVEENNR